MQGLTLALALTGASALVAPAAPRAATALKAADEVFDYSSIAGGESGLGGRYDFDPMNFAGRYPGMVPWFREAELKHGRICMLAVVGWLTVDAGIHFPGEKYAGIDALHAHDAMLASGNMGVMLLFAAVAELTSMVSVVQAAKGSGRAAGDFGLDPLEFCGNPDTKKFMLEAETTHARLAMLGFSGLCTQSALLESHTFPYLS